MPTDKVTPQNNITQTNDIRIKNFGNEFENQTGVSFPCKICQIFLTSLDSLEIHLQSHTIVQSLPCQLPDCEQTFPTQKTMWEHMLHIHKVDNYSWLRQRFQCNHCKKVLKTKYSLKRHKIKHTDKKTFLCTICSKYFKDEKNFYFHTLRHQGILDFKCSECDKLFASKSQLNGHLSRIHISQDYFKCDQCSTEFKTKGQLTVHMTNHTGVKAYVCREGCGKQFRIWNTRKDHERTHTGKKEFQCPKCPKMFMHSSDLRIHIKRHEGRKDHVCVVCGWAYVEPAGARNCQHSRTASTK